MIVQIWCRNDGTGLLDEEMRDGDVFAVYPDSFESSLGTNDKRSWLCVKIPDPPNVAAIMPALVESEWAPGPTPDENIIRRARIYKCNWRSKFTSEEIAIIEDALQTLPDGPYVTSGVVHGKFTIADFSRK